MFEHVSKEDLEAGWKALGGGGVGSAIPIVVSHGEGSTLYDLDGKAYIDCTAQAWSLSVGYSHQKVISAVSEQIKKFTHIRTSFGTIPKLLLSKKLAELAPGNLKKVTYALSGSDANEGAVKLALRNRDGNTFVTLMDAYHGRSLAMINFSWPHPNNRFTAFCPPIIRIPQAYCYRCPLKLEYPSCQLACVEFAKDIILRAAPEPPLALMMEPFQGNGGMICFPPEYFKSIRNLCDELNMLLIFDEIQTGFGRLGAWFAADYYQVTPDILVFGKGVGGGFPLFGVIYDQNLKGFKPGDHSYTFAHFPVSMTAALATIQVIEEENLFENVRKVGSFIAQRLRELQQSYEMIGDVRAIGLMIGVELVKDRKTKQPAREEAERFVSEGLKRGVIFGESRYMGLGNIIKIKPPLVITQSEAEKVLEVFEDILKTFH